MTKLEASDRATKLRTLINEARYAYHVENRDLMSPEILDQLKHELLALETKYPSLITLDSPSWRVAGEVAKGFKSVRHSQPVLSLEDVFSFEELAEWQKKNEKILGLPLALFFTEPKFDGLTCVLTYRQGIFFQGATRGDGQQGEDVTNNVKTIESIPLRLRGTWPDEVVVRGEIIVDFKEFARINQVQKKNDDKIFANPRNLAAGTLRQLDSKVVAQRRLTFMAFELATACGQTTHAEAHQFLKKMGFMTSDLCQVCRDIESVEKYMRVMESKRKKLSFQIDGVVVVVNDIIKEKKLGFIGKTDRWMTAYKFPAEQAIAKILDIVVQVGRLGTITPVAILEPVQLAGTTVSRASLHNQEQIKKLDVRLGDSVIVQKAGDIIPEVVAVVKKLRPKNTRDFNFPSKCPECGTVLEQDMGLVAIFCPNPECPPQIAEKITHAFSKSALALDGIGVSVAEALVKAGVKNFVEMFGLSEADLKKAVPHFVDLAPKKLFKVLQENKAITLEIFLVALSIPQVGVVAARELAKNFKSIEKIMVVTAAEVNQIKNFGPVVSGEVARFFKQKTVRHIMGQAKKIGLKILPYREAGGPLAGQTYLFTGTLENYARGEAKKLLENKGAEVKETFSKDLTAVIAGTDTGSKLAQAQKANVKILTEQEFEHLIK